MYDKTGLRFFKRGEKMKENRFAAKQVGGYKEISIRIPEGLAEKIDEVAQGLGRSRNEVISSLLKQSVDRCEII